MIRPRAYFRFGIAFLTVLLSSASEPHVDAIRDSTGLPVARATLQVRIEAIGSDSFNRTAVPFWNITHLGSGPSIVGVSLNWATSSVIEQRDARFDVDQRGLVGYTLFGNGTAPAVGTFRLGSDIATGLVFDNLATFRNVSIDSKTGGNCGFVATLPANDLNDFRRLDFRFASGTFTNKTFSFDCDTDGGLGYSARDMAGLHVTVTFSNGSALQGELSVDLTHAARAVFAL